MPDKSIPELETLLGKVTEFKIKQFWKAFDIDVKNVIEDWNVTFVKLVQLVKTFEIVLQLKFIGNIIFFKLVQLLENPLKVYNAFIEQVEGK